MCICMKRVQFLLLIGLLMMNNPNHAQNAQHTKLHWSVAAELRNGAHTSIGFAGMVSGISQGKLLMAGGANFPELLPFQGGKKYFSDSVYILESEKGNYNWLSAKTIKLTQPIAYACFATTDKGVFYAGGENAMGISAAAYLLAWNDTLQAIEIKNLPSLPIAVTSSAATAIGNKVFVACGDGVKSSTDKFFVLDLEEKTPDWKSLPSAPKALASASLVAVDNTLYLIGGRTKMPDGISILHASVFSFNIEKNQWQTRADIFDGQKVTPFTASAAFETEGRYIVMVGGDKGDVFHNIEEYLSCIAKAASPEKKKVLSLQKNKLVMHHQGFSTDVLRYDTQKDIWEKIGYMPYPAQVTTSATLWNSSFFICSGEIRPGVRSPKVIQLEME